jgi:CRP-like cAMP-binding protein
MTEKIYKKGEVLFSQGDDADAFYLLKSGRIELFDPRGSKVVAVIEPGRTFGEQAVFSYGARNLSARAIEDSVCTQYLAKDLQHLLEHQPSSVRRAFEMVILQLELRNGLRALGATHSF